MVVVNTPENMPIKIYQVRIKNKTPEFMNMLKCRGGFEQNNYYLFDVETVFRGHRPNENVYFDIFILLLKHCAMFKYKYLMIYYE